MKKQLTISEVNAIYTNWQGRCDKLRAAADQPGRSLDYRIKALALLSVQYVRIIRLSLAYAKAMGRKSAAVKFPSGGVVSPSHGGGRVDGGEYIIPT